MPDGVYFTLEGYQVLGRQVASGIQSFRRSGGIGCGGETIQS